MSKKEQTLLEFCGKPVFERGYILNNRESKNIIMGILDFEYSNQVCKWFIDNQINNVVFYPLSLSQNEM